jgi:hypothetical protein
VSSLAQANPGLQRGSDYQMTAVGDRRGLRVDLLNRSEATGEPERIALFTAALPDGHLFYAVAVAPRGDFGQFAPAFTHVIRSIKLSNHR